MNEEVNHIDEFPLSTTFGDIEIGQYFGYISEKYKKISNLKALNVDRNFEWIFKSDTEVNY